MKHPQNPQKSPAAATSHPTLTLVLNRNIYADNHTIKLTQCSLVVPTSGLLHGLPDSHCSVVSNADVAECTQSNRDLPILPQCTEPELTQDCRLL